MNGKTLILIDGENLVARFNSLCKSGLTPKSDVIRIDDVLVWHHGITGIQLWDILRVCFYTTIAASDEDVQKINEKISIIGYSFTFSAGLDGEGRGTLNPHVYPKNMKTSKTKSVDINITIDALRHAHNKDVATIIICSGDGDYIPLVKEVMRYGVTVQVAAFSDGCNPLLKTVPDDFINLDDIFFEKEAE